MNRLSQRASTGPIAGLYPWKLSASLGEDGRNLSRVATRLRFMNDPHVQGLAVNRLTIA